MELSNLIYKEDLNNETTYYIRPTINLIGDAIVTSGTGEYNAPYQVSLP